MTDLTGIEVQEEHIEHLRRFLSDDPSEPNEPTAKDAIAHNLMAYSAFAVAVLRKFSPTYSVPEIIRYVTDLRKAVVADESLQINPRVAEGLIREVLQDETFTDTAPFGADNETMASASFLILLDLCHQAKLDGPEVEEFLQESTDYARR
ncbi:hypothetical protein D0T12_23175 [Actinomadura spongiicola]|uniref:Uncharacterized protein n=1 Tax=Actinomadura spongiicola TaxID=2303421 RepID=A0A372GCN8_9ACTN|nr:hypothetical protein [Actinomadura spongiicola]RFS83087.1 hypothetical protein D0T12_23175 [Actinomadura spongiicola]